MAKLSEEAKAYKSQQTKNICELPKVSTDLEVIENTFTDSEGKEFSIKTVTVDGQDYRVPISVLRSLKAIIEVKPDLQYFKVHKSGSGMDTQYTVFPL